MWFLKLNISYHCNLCFTIHLPCKSCYSDSSKMSNLLSMYCMEWELVSPFRMIMFTYYPRLPVSFPGGSQRDPEWLCILSAMHGLSPIVNKLHSATREVNYWWGGRGIARLLQISILWLQIVALERTISSSLLGSLAYHLENSFA